MKSLIDLIGQKFSRWTITKFVGKPGTKKLWLCRCDCGVEKIISIYTLQSGGSKSCGCLRKEVSAQRFLTANPGVTKHGMTGTPEWSAYKDARHRCVYATNPRWKDYGGRGVQFLFTSFQQFFSEIGRRPSSDHSLDRIDNNGNYEPGNVKWSTDEQQAANRRQTFKDITGQRFGRLVVIGVAERKGKRGSKIKWLCLCDCGNKKAIGGSNLKRNTRSCGCVRRELMQSKENPWSKVCAERRMQTGLEINV